MRFDAVNINNSFHPIQKRGRKILSRILLFLEARERHLAKNQAKCINGLLFRRQDDQTVKSLRGCARGVGE
jgi:hypothetical protein